MNLAATDHGNNTGATLTVSANSGNASVFVSRFLGANSSRAFASAGTVSGNGTVVANSLVAGAYVGVAVNAGSATTSSPLIFRVTAGADPLHYRMLVAVREFVLSLALPTMSTAPDDHYIVKMPYRPDLELNIENTTDLAVMYFPKPESYTVTDNQRDSVAYSVQVLLVRKIGKQLSFGLKDMLADRQMLGQSFSGCPLPDVDEIHTIQIQPGQIYLPEQWQKGYDCSTIVFRGLTEQPAGIV